MDLLERMLENAPEETEICLELVNHEEFCVDDISVESSILILIRT